MRGSRGVVGLGGGGRTFAHGGEHHYAITTFRGSDANAKERFIYHAAGLDGSGAGSYIDDTVLIDADVNSGWVNAADSTKEVRRYYLHNWRHDVVAILSSAGKLIQNVKYLAYGAAYGLPAGDYDNSGTWTSGDSTAISGYGGGYDIRYDADFNGVIDADDITHANSITGGYYDLALDKLSTEQVFNRKGYAGYEHAWELDGTKYHVRNRVLDSDLGRWTRRDPLGYVDGMGVYTYVSLIVMTRVDPSGAAYAACDSGCCGSGAMRDCVSLSDSYVVCLACCDLHSGGSQECYTSCYNYFVPVVSRVGECRVRTGNEADCRHCCGRNFTRGTPGYAQCLMRCRAEGTPDCEGFRRDVQGLRIRVCGDLQWQESA